MICIKFAQVQALMFLLSLVVRVLTVLLSIMKLSMLQTKTVQDGANYCRVLADGRAIGCEVKRISGDRLKSGKLSSPRFPLENIEPHQVQDLVRIGQRGVGLLVIVYGSPSLDGCFYAVPIRVVVEALKRGAASLLAEDLDPWRVGRNQTVVEVVKQSTAPSIVPLAGLSLIGTDGDRCG